VEEGLHRENIETIRTCEVQSEKTRPRKPTRQISTDGSSVIVLVGKGCLTSSKIIRSFAEVFWVSSSYEDTWGYDTHLTVDRVGGIECEQAKDCDDEGADAC
jgi:hypothetical protein